MKKGKSLENLVLSELKQLLCKKAVLFLFCSCSQKNVEREVLVEDEERSPLCCHDHEEANPRKRNSVPRYSSALAVAHHFMNELARHSISWNFPQTWCDWQLCGGDARNAVCVRVPRCFSHAAFRFRTKPSGIGRRDWRHREQTSDEASHHGRSNLSAGTTTDFSPASCSSPDMDTSTFRGQ